MQSSYIFATAAFHGFHPTPKDCSASEKSIDIWLFPIPETLLDQLIVDTMILRQERPTISVRPMSRHDAVENRAELNMSVVVVDIHSAFGSKKPGSGSCPPSTPSIAAQISRLKPCRIQSINQSINLHRASRGSRHQRRRDCKQSYLGIVCCPRY